MPRPVYLYARAAYLPVLAGFPVPGFEPVAAGIPKKALKTMTRAVQLGVACVANALALVTDWQAIPPGRRGLFVGASPQQGDAEDLFPAIDASGTTPNLRLFAEFGVPLVPPLWLVKGLSNNVLGYASANHDLRGDNGNWCDGRLGGAVAVAAAIQSVAEGRVDLAIGGAADSLVGADEILGRPCGEGAVFFVFGTVPTPWCAHAGVPTEAGAAEDIGELGAVSIPAALSRQLAASNIAFAGGVSLTPASRDQPFA